MGGCSAYDVVHVLEKGREAIEDVVVELDAERAQQDPKVFTRVHMHFVVKGRRLAAEKVKRAIALSVEKYCSASAMIPRRPRSATTSRWPIPLQQGRERTDAPMVGKEMTALIQGGRLPVHMVLITFCGTPGFGSRDSAVDGF